MEKSAFVRYIGFVSFSLNRNREAAMITLPPETEQLARRIAARSGKTLEDVLKEGIELEARLAGIAVSEHAEAVKAFNVDRVSEIVRDIASAPLRDPRSAKEILDEAWGDPA